MLFILKFIRNKFVMKQKYKLAGKILTLESRIKKIYKRISYNNLTKS